MGIRELNRKIQDYLRPKRLALGKFVWDRKKDDEKIKTNNLIENKKIKSILFIRNDGKIGDMVINTLMFREIKKSYPNIKIGVVTRGANKQVIINNPNIDKLYDYDKSNKKIKKVANEIANDKYDLLIDFSEMLRVKQMKFINLCKARYNMGLNKDGWDLFNINIKPGKDYPKKAHITERYKAYLKVLGLKGIDLSYDIHLKEENLKWGRELIGMVNEKILVAINPYGASKYRTLSKESLKKIVKIILEDKEMGVTFIYPPDKLDEIKNLIKELKVKRIYLKENNATILDTASIMTEADLIITPDTSIVHLGVGLGKRMVAIYRSDVPSEEVNSLVWGANSNKVYQIYAKPPIKPNEEGDINNFDMEELKYYLMEMKKIRKGDFVEKKENNNDCADI